MLFIDIYRYKEWCGRLMNYHHQKLSKFRTVLVEAESRSPSGFLSHPSRTARTFHTVGDSIQIIRTPKHT